MSKLDGNYKYDEYIKDLFIKNKYSCEVDKNPLGCRILGDYYNDTKHYEKAAETYRVACETYRDDVSCYKYGVLQAKGQGTEKNFQEAMKNMDFACTKGIGASCFALGVFKLSRDAHEAGLSNPRDSLHYHSLACDLDFSSACAEAGKMNWTAHNVFPDIPKNSAKALSQFKQACLGGVFKACEVVAQMCREGDGTEKDEEMAKKFMELADAGKRKA